MLGQLVVGGVRHEPGEVDDPADTVGAHGAREVGGGRPVGLGEVVAAHPVDQVEDRVHALARVRDLVGIERVHHHGLDPVRPPRHLPLGVGRGGADVVAALEEQRHQPAADVAGGTGDQDLHSVSKRRPPACTRASRLSPIAWAVVTCPAVEGLSSRTRHSADSASIIDVSV